MSECVHILVAGRVQGVFFRASTKQKALELGLRGFVRNLLDGRVEIVAKGNSQSLECFLVWCRQGPPEAEVSDLQWAECETPKVYSSFEIVG